MYGGMSAECPLASNIKGVQPQAFMFKKTKRKYKPVMYKQEVAFMGKRL